MIEFIESASHGYRERTIENAKNADITIAFAVDFATSGEQMTKEGAFDNGKCYFPFNCLLEGNDFETRMRGLADYMRENDCHTVNCAGNAATRFHRFNKNQSYCDTFVYEVFSRLVNEFNINITEIRSGGQSGADESGLKASLKLGIKATCLCPNGFRFRNEKGEDITDEQEFKKRFE